MKTFVIRARVHDGREFEYAQHTETAREALAEVRGKKIAFLGIRQYAGTMSIRMISALPARSVTKECQGIGSTLPT
jgi:hypothetical protein